MMHVFLMNVNILLISCYAHKSLNFKHLHFEIVKYFLHLGFEINRKASNNSISLKRCNFVITGQI